jgi:hypothetical protein
MDDWYAIREDQRLLEHEEIVITFCAGKRDDL